MQADSKLVDVYYS